jgi:hypothetical protein
MLQVSNGWVIGLALGEMTVSVRSVRPSRDTPSLPLLLAAGGDINRSVRPGKGERVTTHDMHTRGFPLLY